MLPRRAVQQNPQRIQTVQENNLELYRKIDSLLTLKQAAERSARQITTEDLSVIKNAAMIVDKGRILWVGEDKKIPKQKKAMKEVSLKGMTVLPGFVECHTHSVFAGDRSTEFELRNQGMTYQQIGEAGGGIKSTVKATRQSKLSDLKEISQKRVDRFLQQGVTTLEIKSGYGLDFDSEVKILKVALSMKGPAIVTTYLGPHSVPVEHKNSKSYMNEILTEHLPKLKKLKLTCRLDMFVESGYFDLEDAEKYVLKAKELGFDLALHADQITRTGACEFGARLGARSVDHAIQINDSDVQILADSETTVVLLPVADMYLKCAYPPARKLIDAGARVAIATDFNPGTSPSQDLSFTGLLSRLEMKMTLPEVIGAYTIGAAYALGLQNECGSLEVGKRADFVAFDEDWQGLFYQIGHHPVRQVWVSGKILNVLK